MIQIILSYFRLVDWLLIWELIYFGSWFGGAKLAFVLAWIYWLNKDRLLHSVPRIVQGTGEVSADEWVPVFLLAVGIMKKIFCLYKNYLS